MLLASLNDAFCTQFNIVIFSRDSNRKFFKRCDCLPPKNGGYRTVGILTLLGSSMDLLDNTYYQGCDCGMVWYGLWWSIWFRVKSFNVQQFNKWT